MEFGPMTAWGGGAFWRKSRTCVLSTRVSSVRALILLVVLLSACASKAPASLTPRTVPVWQANEVVVALTALEEAAIGFNREQICDEAGTCRAMLSDAYTRVVLEAAKDAVQTIRQTPAGWAAVGAAAIERIEMRLGAAGLTRLQPYIMAVRLVLSNLGAA